ncbi:AAA family ATPase [bacterium]|nr:AAA family ATPase [bacterium]
MLKRLPIGQQDFAGLIEWNGIYADKTKIISDLLNLSQFVFLSRPRRFGKSLLISTLENLFEGKKELFKGLWIENNFEWKEVPVVRIDFTRMDFDRRMLSDALEFALQDNAEKYDTDLRGESHKERFFNLIKTLHKKTGERVVLLIDEYDKPIVDYINNLEKAEENREILRTFYGAIKGCSEMLRFVLITGISRFSKMSIFSELNNLKDISMSEDFAAICGFTKDDLNDYFGEYKDAACEKLELSRDELDEKIRFWYDGYKFDGRTHIYNPFSMLNFFSDKEFKNYWFESGLPKLLADFIIQNGVDVRELDNVVMAAEELNNFDVKKIDLKTLMFQTGYLTIVGKDEYNQYILDYPNEEVRSSFVKFLLKNYTDETSSNKRVDMLRALDKGDVDGFIESVNALLASIPYQIIPKENENYFSSLMYVLLKTLGYMVLSELSTYHGRADAVIKTKKFIYIFEYKMAPKTAAEGINQIKTKGYADEFVTDPRKKTAVSIVIDREQRKITEYIKEDL